MEDKEIKCGIYTEKPRTDEAKKALVTRINRLVGQLNGIKKMVENDRTCNEVLIQISAVNAGLKGLANDTISGYIQDNLPEKLQRGDDTALAEIIEYFKRLQ